MSDTEQRVAALSMNAVKVLKELEEAVRDKDVMEATGMDQWALVHIKWCIRYLDGRFGQGVSQ